MAALIGLDGIPIKTSAGNFGINSGEVNVDHITFGAVHLNNTNLKVTIDFWTKVVGEITIWRGHSPEQIKTMKDGIAALKEQGIEAIEN